MTDALLQTSSKDTEVRKELAFLKRGKAAPPSGVGAAKNLDTSPKRADLRIAEAELKRRGSAAGERRFQTHRPNRRRRWRALVLLGGEGRPETGRPPLSFLTARSTPSNSRESELRASVEDWGRGRSGPLRLGHRTFRPLAASMSSSQKRHKHQKHGYSLVC